MSQSAPLKLTIYARPLTSKEPLAFGPLALAYQLLSVAPEFASVLSLCFEDGTGSVNQALGCRLQQDGSSEFWTDTLGVVKTLASACAPQGFAGRDTRESERISAVLAQVQPLLAPNGIRDMPSVTRIADQLDSRLTLRSFLVGYCLTAADWGVWGALKATPSTVPILRKGQHPHLARWYLYIDSLDDAQRATAALAEEAKNIDKGKKKVGTAAANFEEGLPNAVKGSVVTRFPPEPSGYLHIGHCKAAILNQHYAKTYQGRFLVRFDDTNPEKEKEEFQDAIIEDLHLLGIHGDATSYTSDYFEQIYNLAIQMINEGKAFCDDTDQETMRNERLQLKPSKRRCSTVEENLTRFAEMKTGSEEGQRWCLRAKIAYNDLNGTMRDPVIYRTNSQTHHRTGSNWKIYPTYDFACPIVDAVEGVTHALRTNEYRDRNAQYWWMQTALGLRRVEIKDFARCNFQYTLLSKRKLKQFVETGVVRGWDDPRVATVRGIRRRGMTIQALRDFFIGQGGSQQVVNMEWDALWSVNKRIIDPIVPRHTAVLRKDMVAMTLRGAKSTQPWTETVLAHKKNPDVGTKVTVYGPTIFVDQEDAVLMEDNEEITLMDWGNAIVSSKRVEGTRTVEVEASLHLEGDFKKTKKKVHWLVASELHPLQNVVLLDYDYLITKKKIEEEDKVDDFITPVSEFWQEAVADSNLGKFKRGDMLQLERKGYYIVDKPLGQPTTLSEGSGPDWIELIHIPDGRAASTISKAATVKSSTVADAKDSKVTQEARRPAGVSLPAPNEAQTTQLLSNGDSGFEISVTTKMFRIDPHYGTTQLDTPVTTQMFRTRNFYEGEL